MLYSIDCSGDCFGGYAAGPLGLWRGGVCRSSRTADEGDLPVTGSEGKGRLLIGGLCVPFTRSVSELEAMGLGFVATGFSGLGRRS